MIREHRNIDTITALLQDHDSARLIDSQVADHDVASTCRILLAQLKQHNSKEEPIGPAIGHRTGWPKFIQVIL